MAISVTEGRGPITIDAESLQRVPGLRPAVLLVGIALAVAAGVALFLWAQGPSYSLLYGNLEERDAMQVADTLKGANIPYRIEGSGGAVMVPSQNVHEARLLLAGQGLPRGSGVGLELIREDQGFGTSQFIESARYHHALETELARTITNLHSVAAARVHLAIPRQSPFVRDRRAPGASVMLQLHQGRRLEGHQISAITHLVASSIPDLEFGQVTVIDQQGRLLSSPQEGDDTVISATQFEHARRLEETLVRRIEDLITPIVGFGRVRAQVHADLDFTSSERTEEVYSNGAMRSEQTSEDTGRSGGLGSGVPGTLSNQPPETSADGNQVSADAAANGGSRRSTRNFEVDRTISHVRQPAGNLRRLTVAVVVDNPVTVLEDQTRVSTPLTEAQLTQITTLVREAVGFDAERGDSLNVVNSAFTAPEPIEPMDSPSVLAGGGLTDIFRMLIGAALLGLIALGVLRPLLRNLTAPPRAMVRVAAGAGGGGIGALEMNRGAALGAPAGSQGYENQVSTVQSMVQQDPKRVAQVVKGWVGEDG